MFSLPPHGRVFVVKQGKDRPESVTAALGPTLALLDLDGRDEAASALAWRLAALIDAEQNGRTAAELAGKLLAVLEALGATPAARNAILPKGGTAGAPDARATVDELRARRRNRGADGTAAVDASPS